jgi:hypothetical protein
LLSISTLQHLRFLRPFFSLSQESVQRALPCTLEVPSLGFGYPFDGFSSLRTLEVSFNLQRSWASPFEAFLQQRDRNSCFQLSFRSGALPINPFKLIAGASTALSHVASRTPNRTWRFSPGRGPCSLGTFDLLGFPSNQRGLKVFIFPRLPSHPLCQVLLVTNQHPLDLRVFTRWPIGFLPSKRTPAHLAFFTDCPIQPFWVCKLVATYFFSMTF